MNAKLLFTVLLSFAINASNAQTVNNLFRVKIYDTFKMDSYLVIKALVLESDQKITILSKFSLKQDSIAGKLIKIRASKKRIYLFALKKVDGFEVKPGIDFLINLRSYYYNGQEVLSNGEHPYLAINSNGRLLCK